MKFLRYFHNLNVEVVKAIADDFRKVGTYALGLALAGWVLDNDNMVSDEAYLLSILGLICWAFGILCTYISDKFKQGEK